MKKLPKIGLLYLDFVLQFFNKSNFKGWPDKIEKVTYHWKNDKKRFIEEVKRKKIEILVGNIPATAYETFVEISKELPNVRFVPSIETQFSNKSKENVTLFCKKFDLAIPKTKIFYNQEKGYKYLKEKATYPQIIKRSYGPSNYGGYFVHKANDYKEAKKLLDDKKYNPIYTQNAIDLKDSGDIRVMLIGHKPICAFWRYSGKNQWITNTSQGGSMSYENVPMNALELAVKASKAAKAEYWACDIAICAKTGKAYILECATAFAAFPYVRDWICQYLMWDFSKGRFNKPHIPLFSWEELGKIDPNLLRTLRHIGFSKYTASYDGEYFFKDKQDIYEMELALLSHESDVPEKSDENCITLEECQEFKTIQENKINFNSATLTDLMSLHGMEEDLALQIQEYLQENIITDSSDLLELEAIDEQMLKSWDKNIDDMRIDINIANKDTLRKIKGIGKKLSKIIHEYKEKNGNFKCIEDLKNIEGIGKNKFAQLKSRLKIGE